MKKSTKKPVRSKISLKLESYRKEIKELESKQNFLREKASEKIVKLNSAVPKWTLLNIADKLGISGSAVSKIKAKDGDIGMETIGRVLEADFD